MSRQLESLLSPLTVEQQERLALVLTEFLEGVEQGGSVRLDELLAAHPDLTHPIKEYVRSLSNLQQMTNAAGSSSRSATNWVAEERRLGDYRLVREVGRGGMGVVYEARQISLGRTVAVKLLPFSAFFDQKQIARFQNEAQAAAGLHHPHIVSVFAVGCERGVHYYSMQFIDGQSLDEVIRGLRREATNRFVPESSWKLTSRLLGKRSTRRSTKSGAEDGTGDEATSVGGQAPSEPKEPLDGCMKATLPASGFSTVRCIRSRNYVRGAVELAMQAADALHHAHQCGVVHRDVKPSNLLLDRFGKLWMTDFGLARCELGPDLTATGDLLGTLRYMSPEQAAAQSHLVDHRTDIYSLGVTLFELLTLRPAYEGSDRAEVLRQIREEPIPCLRLLNASIPYDLETIVLKATAKSRDDRYGSAQEFHDDLRRFLDGEPAHARRPTAVDRSLKWLTRHRRIAAGVLVMVALLFGLTATALTVIARKQLETDRALTRARQHFAQVQRVVDRFGAGVSEKLSDVPGAEGVRSELLTETLEYYQAILAYAGDDPALRRDAAKALFKIGAVQEQIGRTDEASTSYRLAQSQLDALSREHPDEPTLVADLALCENNLGALQTRLGQHASAESLLQLSVSRLSGLEAKHPENADFRDAAALARINLGLALAEMGRFDAAEKSYRAAVEALSGGGSADPAKLELRIRLATAFHNLSGLIARDNPFEAERLASKAVSLLRNTNSRKGQAALGLALANLGALLSERGQLDEAITELREAIGFQEKLVQASQRNVVYRLDLASSHNNLGQTFLNRGDVESAEIHFDESRRLFEELVKDAPGEPFHFGGLAGVLNNLAMVRERRGDYQGAKSVLEQAVAFQRSACDRAPRVQRYREFLDQHYANLIRVLENLGHEKEADELRRRDTTVRKI